MAQWIEAEMALHARQSLRDGSWHVWLTLTGPEHPAELVSESSARTLRAALEEFGLFDWRISMALTMAVESAREELGL